MGDGAPLVFPQGDVRVHAAEHDMAPVILTGAGGVEKVVVGPDQISPPLGVAPHPVPESILNGLLFLLGKGGLFLVQHPLLFPVHILNGVVDTDIPEVQRVFQDTVGAGPVCAVGHIGHDIVPPRGVLARDLPLRGGG